MYVNGVLSCPKTQAITLCVTAQRRPHVTSSPVILATVIQQRPPVIHSNSSHVAVHEVEQMCSVKGAGHT